MKIKKIELKNYKQFKDLTLDLIYPEGHEKAGEPLDKICIIGQSGTGKTNLLEAIRDKLYKTEVKVSFLDEEKSNVEEIYFSDINKICSKNNNHDIKYLDRVKGNMKKLIWNALPFVLIYTLIYGILQLTNFFLKNSYLESIIKLIFLLVIPLLILFAILFILVLIVAVIMDNIQKIFNITSQYVSNKYYIELDESAWYLLIPKINNYSRERDEYQVRKSQQLLVDGDYEKEDFQRDIKAWDDKNVNILDEISFSVNNILNKFNLELLPIDKKTKKYNDLTFQDLSNDNIIKYDDLSTGTKNLIATFIPLKIHNPKDSIILIDEPENSFYPDIQRKLTELYMEVGENNQVIFATHSPLIASSFEPWEVVELKFDKNNQVYREKYFEGDIDHIDNYTLDPRMLTWTGILTDIFDIKSSSNSDFRENALIEFNILKEEIKNIEDIEKKKNYLKSYKIWVKNWESIINEKNR